MFSVTLTPTATFEPISPQCIGAQACLDKAEEALAMVPQATCEFMRHFWERQARFWARMALFVHNH